MSTTTKKNRSTSTSKATKRSRKPQISRDAEITGEALRSADDDTIMLDDAPVIEIEPEQEDPPPPSAEDLILASTALEATVRSALLTTGDALRRKATIGDGSRPDKPVGAVRRLTGRAKVGGVAPFVAPANRLGYGLRMREWRQRGFVPLSPGRAKIRHRILPRSVIGICFMLLSMGVGAAFSGAAFYAYYDDRLAENERAVARFVEGFDQQYTDASGAIDQIRVESIEEVRHELRTLHDYVADAEGVINLPQVVGESVWMLETRNHSGAIVNGSAFAVVGHDGGTALVTSYALVESSTVAPSPALDLIKGNRRVPAQLWSWDEERDLAVVVVDVEIPTLEFAGDRDQVDTVGSRIFALSGVGGQGATASPGVLLDNSLSGLQHTVPLGSLFDGGPLLNGDGKVMGVASLSFRPFGIDPGDVRQAPDVRAICAVILECSEIREEITIDVVADEADAPLRENDDPVRVPSEQANEPSEPTTTGDGLETSEEGLGLLPSGDDG